MKFITNTLLATLFSTVCFAQDADKALARVSYKFSHMQDTTQKEDLYTENMLLVIGKNASVYTSYDKITRNTELRKKLEEQIKNQGGMPSNLNLGATSPRQVTPVDYFYFVNENKFYTKERIVSNYLVEETAPKINWKIGKDTASFSGIKCQKATTYFKGRNWIAWFAPELAFQSGPWKLNGLPGLIIEAYDEKNQVKFQFAGLEKVIGSAAPQNDNQPINISGGGTIKFGGIDGTGYLGTEISLPTDAVKTTLKDIEKLKAARDADPQGFLNAQMAGRTTGSVVVTGNRSFSVGGTAPKKIVINNPIELPEKK